jgi:hypothetical protein
VEKFFEKPKTAIYRGAFGMGSNPNREAICVPDKLGEKPKDAVVTTHYSGRCAIIAGPTVRMRERLLPKRKITFATLYLLQRVS